MSTQRVNTSRVGADNSPTAHVDGRPLFALWFGLPQYLVGNRRGVSLPKQDEAEQVHDGVAFCPPEVAVGGLTGSIPQMEQEGSDGVGHHRALGAEHLVASDLHAPHLEHVLEL